MKFPACSTGLPDPESGIFWLKSKPALKIGSGPRKWSRQSLRIDPMTRSAKGFCQGRVGR
jgi:hypothetical protein